jgi:RNA polymerase sigma-70 factor (ECF subfamily)
MALYVRTEFPVYSRARLPHKPDMSPGKPAQEQEQGGPSHKRFQTTHWSVILNAKNGWPDAGPALEELCRSYWAPVYAFLRGKGHSEHDAEDLVQGFFAHLLESDFLRNVAPGNGLFRSFLLTSVKNFAINDFQRFNTTKRGRDHKIVSLDALSAEGAVKFEPSAGHTAEHAFERRWAVTILDRALGRLENEFRATGKSDHFQALKPWLTGDQEQRGYGSAAEQLGMSEATLRVSVHRLRARYGELVRDEVAQTVSDVKEVDAEIRHLLSLLSS